MKEKIYINKLNPKTVDILRDTAVKIEKDNLLVAQELMNIAHLSRPTGPFIKKKLEEYNKQLKDLNKPTKSELKLKKMVESGEIAIVSAGFRCHTKMNITKKLKISQHSLPFDSGFFPPSSIVSVLKNPKITLRYPEIGSDTHAVCIKYENYNDSKFGKGIKFQKSTYNEINSLATCKDIKDINKYLDSTFGYYTLDLNHNFVLAHYNWHEFADSSKSKGVVDPSVNLENINNVLNKRIDRMFDMCNNAKYIFFIFDEDQGYNYMMIDDEKFDLNDLSEIQNSLDNRFKAKSFILNLSKFKNAEDILKMID